MFHNRYIGDGYDDVVFRDQVDGEQIVETKLREDADPRDDYNLVSVKALKDAVNLPGGAAEILKVIPSDTSEENKLVNEAYVEIKDKTIAAALNDLNARLAALESQNGNIGSVVADDIDTQSLKVGGVDINTIIENAIGG